MIFLVDLKLWMLITDAKLCGFLFFETEIKTSLLTRTLSRRDLFLLSGFLKPQYQIPNPPKMACLLLKLD